MSVDYDEIAMARWMLNNGVDANAKAAVDADSIGGHTALFGCVISQSYRANCRFDDEFARLLLDHGADPTVRASLRKRLRFVPDETMHEYRNVTPLEWGERFHDQDWVSPSVMRLLQERMGSQPKDNRS
jgi:ankyrin repeat protein